MKTFHRVGVGCRSQCAKKTTPKKMAKSVVGKSILDRAQSRVAPLDRSTKHPTASCAFGDLSSSGLFSPARMPIEMERHASVGLDRAGLRGRGDPRVGPRTADPA